MKLIYFAFVIAFIAANLIVKHFGPTGLLISSFLLIPFDFVTRCIIHETIKGFVLFMTLLILTIIAAVITLFINGDAINIAIASICGFTIAQIVAGFFYQWRKSAGDSYFVKVNMSDFLAIVFDSVVFQLVAFSVISWQITGGQVLIKFLGGIFWYLIFFRLIKIQKFIEYERRTSNRI